MSKDNKLDRHTPGPWKEGYYTGDIYAELVAGHSWSRIAAVTGEASGLITPDEAEANARLIAAAPDMLEALEQAWHLIHSFGPKPKDSTYTIVADKARAAIAKAKGE